MTRRALLLAWLLSPLGCESVPTLTFAETLQDSATSDGDIEAACPVPSLPDGGSACCGAIPCSGECTQANCATCEGSCDAGMLCCAKLHNVVCRPLGSACP